MKNLLKNLSMTIASLGLLLQVSTASAGIITFDYDDTVTVGDEFVVNVYADIALTDELTGFGFDLSSDTNNTSFLSAVINTDFWDDGYNQVSGSLDFPFNVINGDVLLASLTFSADAVGSDTVSLLGDNNNFGGLYLLNSADFLPFFEDIDTSFNVNVSQVPEPSTLVLFGLALFGLQRFRKS
jgi:hypothetical protein